MRTVYISEPDEREFTTKAECHKHEVEHRKTLFAVRFYDGRKRMPVKTYEDLEEFYNKATRIIFPTVEVKRAYEDFIGFCAIDKNGRYTNHNDHLKYRINKEECSWQED